MDAIAALAQMMSVPAPPQNLRSQVPTSNAAESEQRAGLQSLDLAKLQLEAMQALLMMLPLPLPQVSCILRRRCISLYEYAAHAVMSSSQCSLVLPAMS